MCGIYGQIGCYEYQKVEACIRRLSHRGPDALQIQTLDGVVLAHTRLSILDVSEGGNQPMCCLNGRYWVVFNGEIYNFLELRHELKQKGYNFRTDTDTEVLAAAYDAWGYAFQKKMNGMWAFAIWDTEKREVFLSRDRFGVKPLYIYKSQGSIAFASEMKAFFPLMQHRYINDKLFFSRDWLSYESTTECVIRDIERFPAGSFAIIRDGNMVIKRWWNTAEHLENVSLDYNEQVRRFQELFFDAVKIRMRSDVPIGTALSGGVDSSCVLAAIKAASVDSQERMTKDWQHAFVASLPGTNIDETNYALLAGRFVGVDVEPVQIAPDISEKELCQYIYYCEDPYITSPIPFIQTYRAIKKKGISVTIDGHGADELFCGYGSDVLYAALDARKDCDEAKAREVLNTFREMQLDADETQNSDSALYDTALSFLGSYGSDKDGYALNGVQAGFLNRQLYAETHEIMLPTLMRCYDRYSMASGVEIRMPFLDWRIVVFAFSIGYSSKVRNGFTKAIVRDAMRGYMDRKILYRKRKIGFTSPMINWARGRMREFFLDTIHSQDFKEFPLVNPLRAEVMLNKVLHGNEVSQFIGDELWKEVLPFLWKKAVIDDAGFSS